MSATPIPRTLQMSLAGLRDISVIETPPEGRRPVRTYVGEYDEELVQQALEREVRARRPGLLPAQPRRDDRRDRRAAARAVPGACASRSPTARWTRSELEERMLAFLRGDADVLVCTIDHRVGHRHPAGQHADRRARRHASAWPSSTRSAAASADRRERAYAYLLYPAAAALTQEAAQRLSALSDYTELGAGFKIAMRDLEIRGAGNLLGDEQSGHVAALGFELYMQMLDEAVRAAQGRRRRRARTPEPVRLDVNVDAYVPADYIPYEQAKIDVHRRIAGAREVADARASCATSSRTASARCPSRWRTCSRSSRRASSSARPARATVTLPRRPPRGHADRARLARAPSACARRSPRRSTSRAARSSRCACPTTRPQRFPAVVRAADALLAVVTRGRDGIRAATPFNVPQRIGSCYASPHRCE